LGVSGKHLNQIAQNHDFPRIKEFTLYFFFKFSF
jgi:hypothetical protein